LEELDLLRNGRLLLDLAQQPAEVFPVAQRLEGRVIPQPGSGRPGAEEACLVKVRQQLLGPSGVLLAGDSSFFLGQLDDRLTRCRASVPGTLVS
jgi:hypothetical protein